MRARVSSLIDRLILECVNPQGSGTIQHNCSPYHTLVLPLMRYGIADTVEHWTVQMTSAGLQESYRFQTPCGRQGATVLECSWRSGYWIVEPLPPAPTDHLAIHTDTSFGSCRASVQFLRNVKVHGCTSTLHNSCAVCLTNTVPSQLQWHKYRHLGDTCMQSKRMVWLSKNTGMLGLVVNGLSSMGTHTK